MRHSLKVLVSAIAFTLSGNDMADLEELQTTKCHKYNHPAIVAKYDGSNKIADDITVTLNSFEENVANGTVYWDGQTSQLGMILNEFSKTEYGNELFSPLDAASV